MNQQMRNVNFINRNHGSLLFSLPHSALLFWYSIAPLLIAVYFTGDMGGQLVLSAFLPDCCASLAHDRMGGLS